MVFAYYQLFEGSSQQASAFFRYAGDKVRYVSSGAGRSPDATGTGSPVPGGPSVAANGGAPTVAPGGTVTFFSRFAGEEGTSLRLDVHSVEYRSEVPGSGQTPARPRRGVFVVLVMTVTNVGNAPGQFNSPNLVWTSPSGERIEGISISLGAGADDQGRTDTSPQPGQHAKGTKYFDVPAKGGHLDYEIGSGSTPLVTLVLPPE